MEVSFTKNPVVDVETVKVETPVPGVTVEANNTAAGPVGAPGNPSVPAVIPTQPALTPAKASHNPTAFDEEDIGYEDVIVPRINIVQKVGDLSNVFPGGEIVLGQTVSIHEPADDKKNKPGTGMLNIVILGFRRRQYTEKVGGGKLGMLLNSEEDVVKNNGTLDYNEWKESLKPGATPKRYFERLATALLLVEKPAHVTDADQTLFPYECDGKFYVLALWSMKGISYTNAAKQFFTARKTTKAAFRIKNGPDAPDTTSYSDTVWGLTTKLEAYGENWAYKPVVRANGKTTEAFKGLVRAILG